MADTSSNIPTFLDDVDQDILEKIASILRIPITHDWGIISEPNDRNRDDLYMLHYTNTADLDVFGWIRGLVVSVRHGVIVADSYGYNPYTVTPYVIPDANGFITFIDNDNRQHVIHLNEAVFRHGCEGFMVRTFKWNGLVYKVSHRSFNIEKSRWGDSLPFGKIYEMMGGPNDSDLYDPAEDFSTYMHMFMCQHPTMLQVTNNEPGNGILYYLGFRRMWPLAPQDCPFKYKGLDDKPMLGLGQTVEEWEAVPKTTVGYMSIEPMNINRRYTIPTLEEEQARMAVSDRPEVVDLPTMNLGQVNELLKTGYVRFNGKNLNEVIDPRWGTGEFVVLYLPDGSLLSIRSIAYDWRSKLLNQNPNRRLQFYKLAYEANLPTLGNKTSKSSKKELESALQDFQEKWPTTIKRPMDEVEEILKQRPLRIWDPRPPEEIKQDLNDIRNFNDRLYCIWVSFLLSAPYNRQMDIFKMYDSYFLDIEKLVEWMWQNKDNLKGDPNDNTAMSIKRNDIRNIVNRCATYLGKPNDQRKFRLAAKKALQQNNGARLYGMVREMELSIRVHDSSNENIST